ncbi:MAG TPA: hypothetical protein VEZ11_03380 [Thermoanaerobaculia bacterium]|nr:hypothetical protein [Thermoanaerobaculia bacterium]
MKRIAIVLLMMFATTCTMAGDATLTFAHDWAPTIAGLESAYLSGDEPGIRAAIQSLQSISQSATNPKQHELVEYAIAYANWRLMYLPGTTADDRKALLGDGRNRLEAVLKSNPKNAEAHALLGSLLGAQIAFERGRAAELGMRSSRERQAARDLEPGNPRVLLLEGTSLFHTPPEYGGGPDVAEPILRHALQAFESEPVERPWPNWGRFDAHVWLGQLLEKAGKREAARSEYLEAQKLAPRSAYIRVILLPRVQSTKP